MRGPQGQRGKKIYPETRAESKGRSESPKINNRNVGWQEKLNISLPLIPKS